MLRSALCIMLNALKRFIKKCFLAIVFIKVVVKIVMNKDAAV